MLETLKDLWLTAKGIRYYETVLSRSQNWPVRQMEEYQFQHLKSLLMSCYESTQYYHDLFWNCDFDPYKDFDKLDDLKKIPLLTKEIARENQPALCNPKIIQDSLELRTSGSTGDIFKEYVSRSHWVIEQGIVWRHWKWMEYRFRDKMAIVRSYVPGQGEPLWKLDRVRNFLYFSAYHLTPDNAKSYLEEMRDWRPKFLRGYPSSLYILAKMAQDLKIDLPPLKGILTASETLLPTYRETIESVFGARVFDWYGQAEITITINECGAHEGMHINSEYGFCELSEDPALPSNERKIIATCLHNEAMPLIRYDTGDVAILKEPGQDVCSHGHTLPLIQGIRGRSDDFLFAPDGRVIPSVNLYTMMDKYDEFIAFQFVQRTRDTLELRLQTHQFNSATENQLRRDLADRFGDEIKINIHNDAAFVQTAEGKKRVIISEVKGHDFAS